ncbi:hypothetical protein [Nocardia bhagyanarayanae]|uniref:Uncharacterized protein n=1 Tax=Nocardia bhagyanarayanae TaxID=1215925 RepID=A0A543EXY7_9NOCA|nr:hypothetical protein [Nocardia bhagyanarayanae]TQM26448.1 hypothetical protein FB390_6642 [Nocardia bhagyanarayanae]
MLRVERDELLSLIRPASVLEDGGGMSTQVKRTLRERRSDRPVKDCDTMQSKFDRLIAPDRLLSPRSDKQ